MMDKQTDICDCRVAFATENDFTKKSLKENIKEMSPAKMIY